MEVNLAKVNIHVKCDKKCSHDEACVEWDFSQHHIFGHKEKHAFEMGIVCRK